MDKEQAYEIMLCPACCTMTNHVKVFESEEFKRKYECQKCGKLNL